MKTIDQIKITTQKKVTSDNGKIMQFLKKSDDDFSEFGEAYFSTIKKDNVKAWKKHKLMTSNIFVPYGNITFVFVDEDETEESPKRYKIVELPSDNNKRITIPPNVWFGFKGTEYNESILINLANYEHDPSEVERKDINYFSFDWSIIK